jgi:hypothetical protein
MFLDIGGDGVINCISASGLGFPSGVNFVAQNVYAPEGSQLYKTENLWPLPAIGQTVFFRMYLRQSLPNNANTGNDHGFQSNAGDIKWHWNIAAGDTNSFDLICGKHSGSVFTTVCDAPKNAALRLEWAFKRTATSTGQCIFRCYNAAGTLLGTATQTGITTISTANFREALWGLSGQGTSSYSGGSVYWGAIAVRVGADDEWVGAYPHADEA